MHLERVECLLKNVILRRIDFDGMCTGVWRMSNDSRQQIEIDQLQKWRIILEFQNFLPDRGLTEQTAQ